MLYALCSLWSVLCALCSLLCSLWSVLRFLTLYQIQYNPENFLEEAREALRKLPLKKMKCSSILKSSPLLGMAQPDYLNQLVCGITQLKAEELLMECQAIEKRLGRIREKRWGPRTIDIDIISYGQQTIDSPILKIPHPEMEKRAFVLMPLQEISPQWTHPVSGHTIDELLEDWKSNSSEPLPVILSS